MEEINPEEIPTDSCLPEWLACIHKDWLFWKTELSMRLDTNTQVFRNWLGRQDLHTNNLDPKSINIQCYGNSEPDTHCQGYRNGIWEEFKKKMAEGER